MDHKNITYDLYALLSFTINAQYLIVLKYAIKTKPKGITRKCLVTRTVRIKYQLKFSHQNTVYKNIRQLKILECHSQINENIEIQEKNMYIYQVYRQRNWQRKIFFTRKRSVILLHSIMIPLISFSCKNNNILYKNHYT